MRVFLTGASGRIGTHIIPHLVSRGHIVSGLIRSAPSAEKIKALGSTSVQTIIGTLSDRDILVENAKSHDAIIHCAMDHSNIEEGWKQEEETVQLFADAIEGTNKIFIMSSGTAALPNGADERSLPPLGMMKRCDTEVEVLKLGDRGIRSMCVRLAMNTHSPEKAHLFFEMLLGAAETLGYIPYLEGIRWSACHAEDAGLLYVLAIENPQPGLAIHSVSEFVEVKDIAEALAKSTGKKAGLVQKEKLGQLGFLGMLLGLDQDDQTTWTRETFGWDPEGQGVLAEIETAKGDYL